VNSFSAVVIKAVQAEVRRHGYALFVAASDELAEDEERWAKALAPQVDGLIVVSPVCADAALRELADLVPLVVTNRLLDDVPAVLTDSKEATGHAVEHLHALGHRRLAYLAGPDGYSNANRAAGLHTTCAHLGLDPVELGPFSARFSSGVRAADLVLATDATAVVAFNDDIAAGLLNRFADRGVRVPDDMSVVGHDDTALAEMVTPRLTTVHIPAAAAGAAGARMLLDRVRSDNGTTRGCELTSELAVRASTGPARAR
jgi:DNA-binding LacI/PurR family transcriptional regulator